MSADSDFQAFLIGAKMSRNLCEGPARFDQPPAACFWTLWVDPGTHTGLCSAVYALPGPESAESPEQLGVRIHHAMERLSIAGWHGEAGAPAHGAVAALGAVLMNLHTELLMGPENEMVSKIVGRVRRIGQIWSERPGSWTAGDDDTGLAGAGIGAERFVVMRADRGHEYLSPVRITAALGYALEDEFGVQLAQQQPSDAKKLFSSDRLRHIGLYQEGPDHVRDAMGHTFLAIRKSVM